MAAHDHVVNVVVVNVVQDCIRWTVRSLLNEGSGPHVGIILSGEILGIVQQLFCIGFDFFIFGFGVDHCPSP